MFKHTCALLATVALAVSADAQGVLTDNEPVKANLKSRETHTWTVELKGEENEFQFAVTCKTGQLRGTLTRVGERREVMLFAVGDKGERTAAVSIRTDKKNDEFVAAPQKPLPAGKYQIVIQGERPGTDLGAYTIQILSPTFAKPVGPGNQPPLIAPAPGGKPGAADEVAALKKEIEALKRRVELLERLVLERK